MTGAHIQTHPSNRAAPGEALYRDEAHFREVLATAARRCRRYRRRQTLTAGALTLLVVATIIFHFADWISPRDLGHGLLPPLDLGLALWILVAALTVILLASSRADRYALRYRLCLRCAAPLRDVPTSETGGGLCPTCQRPFNLSQFRAPASIDARRFRHYIDREHFDRSMQQAVERIIARSTLGGESRTAGLALGAIIALVAFELVTGPHDLTRLFAARSVLLSVAALLWLAWVISISYRVHRIRSRLLPHRLCLTCGYCLLHAPIDDDGVGACPECGRPFNVAEYERPASRPRSVHRADAPPPGDPPPPRAPRGARPRG